MFPAATFSSTHARTGDATIAGHRRLKAGTGMRLPATPKFTIGSSPEKSIIPDSTAPAERPCAVPDQAYIHLDRRLTFGDTKESAVAEVKAAIKRAGVTADV